MENVVRVRGCFFVAFLLGRESVLILGSFPKLFLGLLNLIPCFANEIRCCFSCESGKIKMMN
jgi:hypothetical protein